MTKEVKTIAKITAYTSAFMLAIIILPTAFLGSSWAVGAVLFPLVVCWYFAIFWLVFWAGEKFLDWVSKP